MKKLLALTLMFIGFSAVSMAQDTWTVAGNSSDVFGASWDPSFESNDMTNTEGTIWKLVKEGVTLIEGQTYEYKVVKNHSWGNGAYPASNRPFAVSETAVYDITFTFNSGTNEVSENCVKTTAVIPNATITSVIISGAFNNWKTTEEEGAIILEKVGETDSYTATLDFTSASGNQEFKLVPNGNWLKYDEIDFDVSNPSDWLTRKYDSNQNIILHHDDTHFYTYTVTATWTPSPNAAEGWTLKIEGKDAVPMTTYSVTFVNQNWVVDETHAIHAYAWNNTSDYVTENAWPGDVISKTGTVTINDTEYDVYTYRYTGYSAPQKIQFNDGTSYNKTEDLTFEDGTQYNAPAAWATITSAVFNWGVSGDETTWNNVSLTKAADSYTWTGTLDMTGITEARQFKLDINEVWLGQNEIAVIAPNGWITAGNGDRADITLNHDKTHFLTYTITATWTPSTDATTGWTVTIAGDTEAPKSTYTVNFVKGWSEWSTVYAYFYNYQETETPDFPGTEMTATEETMYGFTIYTLSIQSYSAPTGVTFSDGTNAHKVDATFENNMTYKGVSFANFTVSDKGWATAKTTSAVDFSYAEGLEAYTATIDNKTVTLTKATKVPQNTALVLKGITAQVPIIVSAPAVENNALIWYDNYTVNDSHRFIFGLTVDADGNAKFAKVNSGQTFSNKAVLEVEPYTIGAARELSIIFAGDEANGIDAVVAEKNVEGIYNMNGQRVTAPTKGLYIVNGKKVILK